VNDRPAENAVAEKCAMVGESEVVMSPTFESPTDERGG
jgi:hypothetical protein